MQVNETGTFYVTQAEHYDGAMRASRQGATYLVCRSQLGADALDNLINSVRQPSPSTA
jgi:hypothetical protein